MLLDATGQTFGANEVTNTVLKQEPQIDPYLKLEIENFLKWINDPNGLRSYISLYLEQNDYQKIQALSAIYKTLYRIFSNNDRRIKQAWKLAKNLEPVSVGSRFGERMVMMKISEAAKPGAERFILDR